MSVKYDIKWPKELIQKRTPEMIDTSGREIVRGIRKNIVTSMGVTGGQFRKLESATIRKKRGMRYPSRPLFALGILYRSIHYFTGHRPNIGTVGIKRVGKPNRRDVAEWQQAGPYGGPARRFFGISRKLNARLNSMWGAWFSNIIRRADSYKKGKF